MNRWWVFTKAAIWIRPRNRAIMSNYAYQRGAATILDVLDAERSYRATQLAYRQALAAQMIAAEQVNLVVGTQVIR